MWLSLDAFLSHLSTFRLTADVVSVPGINNKVMVNVIRKPTGHAVGGGTAFPGVRAGPVVAPPAHGVDQCVAEKPNHGQVRIAQADVVALCGRLRIPAPHVGQYSAH